ncbi:alpha-2,3-sialyltransferase [Vibrio hangzhouensis]|uniref:alpha-2,3-sialyltransferase n=1 Tax=Vibrio hangzhouensis TaxID=462991 RepID=UPI001C98D170|nr:alpha-2,3-sialyltransferase [Vibrio hangzhouensis]MBY6198486.1 hypothetical protein [Vibrio hangzhouensis]
MSFPKYYADVSAEVDRIRSFYQNDFDKTCYVIGNGPSANDFTLSEDEIENSIIFRMNWFFLEEQPNFGRRIDGYFSSIDVRELREHLAKVLDSGKYEIRKFFQPHLASNTATDVNIVDSHLLGNSCDHWAVIASDPTLARNMMGRPLPTQGMQALAFAAIIGFKNIKLIGVDFYQDLSKRYAWEVPDEVKSVLQEKDYKPGYEKHHSLDYDLKFYKAIRSRYDFTLSGAPFLSPLLDDLDHMLANDVQSKRSIASSLNSIEKQAFVTLADGEYAIGALALARSLKKHSNIPLVVMYSQNACLFETELRQVGNVILKKVAPIDNPHSHGQERFTGTFTKLNAFNLTEYDKIVFVDSDCIVLTGIDELFEREDFSACPDWGVALRNDFNSGLFVVKPSEHLFNDLTSAMKNFESDDGGDQGFLNAYFRNKVSFLPYTYNTLKRLPVAHPSLVNESEIKVIHYVGMKPWDINRDKDKYAYLENYWLEHITFSEWKYLYWKSRDFKVTKKEVIQYAHRLKQAWLNRAKAAIKKIIRK